jgi:hypothetical protein
MLPTDGPNSVAIAQAESQHALDSLSTLNLISCPLDPLHEQDCGLLR